MTSWISFFLWLLQAVIIGLLFVEVLKPRWEKIPKAVLLLLFPLAESIPTYVKISVPPVSQINIICMFLNIGILFALELILFSDRISRKFMILLYMITIGILGELIVSSFVNLSNYQNSDVSNVRLFAIVLYTYILIIFVGLFILINRKLAANGKARISDYILFMLFPVSQFIWLFNADALDLFPLFGENLAKNQHLIASVIGVAADIYLVFVMTEQVREQQMEKDYQQLLYLREKEKEHLQSLEEKNQAVAKIRHDYKNQINALGLLIRSKRYDEAEQLTDDLGNAIAASGGTVYCPNAVVNSVVTEKAGVCEAGGIRLETDLAFGDLKRISKLHICSIFSNLLDNGIHAAERCEEGKRFIRINAGFRGAYLVITLENSSPDPTGSRKTHKGYGLEIINDIVREYNGYYSGEQKNGKYEAIVSLMDEN